MRFFTLTWTASPALVLPALSVARTASEWAPFATEKLSQMAVKGAAATVTTVEPSTWKSTLLVPAGTEADRETCPATDEPALRPSSFGPLGVGAGAGVPVGLVPPEGMSLADDPPLPLHEMASANPTAASVRRTAARLVWLF